MNFFPPQFTGITFKNNNRKFRLKRTFLLKCKLCNFPKPVVNADRCCFVRFPLHSANERFSKCLNFGFKLEMPPQLSQFYITLLKLFKTLNLKLKTQQHSLCMENIELEILETGDVPSYNIKMMYMFCVTSNKLYIYLHIEGSYRTSVQVGSRPQGCSRPQYHPNEGNYHHTKVLHASPRLAIFTLFIQAEQIRIGWWINAMSAGTVDSVSVLQVQVLNTYT